MITIKLSNQKEYTLNFNKKEVLMNNVVVDSDWITIAPNKYHVLINNQSYTIELLSKDETGKQLILMVNGQKQLVVVEDKYDALLKHLGMDKMVKAKVNEVKAPMPGLVLRVLVTQGDTVKKGDALLVLEAMKMENIIKATDEGIVKLIKVEPKLAVEKNQVLMVME